MYDFHISIRLPYKIGTVVIIRVKIQILKNFFRLCGIASDLVKNVLNHLW